MPLTADQTRAAVIRRCIERYFRTSFDDWFIVEVIFNAKLHKMRFPSLKYGDVLLCFIIPSSEYLWVFDQRNKTFEDNTLDFFKNNKKMYLDI